HGEGGPRHEPIVASSGPGRHAGAGRRRRWRSSPTEHRHSKARPPRPLLAPRPLRVGQSGGLRGGVPVSPASWNRDGDARSQRRSAARRLTGAPWDDRRRRHPVDDLGKRHPPRGNASETSRRDCGVTAVAEFARARKDEPPEVPRSGGVSSHGAGGGRFLLAAARPLHEPIARYGPFVMNTRAEIEQTLADLRTGNFIRKEPRDE